MLEWIFQSAQIILADAVQVTEKVVETAIEASVEVTPAIEAVATQAGPAQASMPVDWSLLIAIAALVFSVASPIFSAWITGHYQLKQKDLEYRNAARVRDQVFYTQHRAEVVESYLRAAGATINNETFATREEYGKTVAEMYIYLPKRLWGYLDSIDEFIEKGQRDLGMNELTELAGNLSDEHIRFESHKDPKKAKEKKVDEVPSK